VFVAVGVAAAMDVNPDLTEGLPGGDDFPAAAAMSGQSNTVPTSQSTAVADVGLPGDFNGTIAFTDLTIKTTNTPGLISGFGSFSVPLDLSGQSFQLVAGSARLSSFEILLDAPFSSPLTATGNPEEYLWEGLANVRLVGTFEPTVTIPTVGVFPLGSFPFDQAVTIPLAGTFSGIPTGTEVTVGIPQDVLNDQDLSLPLIEVQLPLGGLEILPITGFFVFSDLTLADISTEVVYRNATPIPEPGMALLLGLGLAGLAALRRR
jgi:hypothetical protein